MKIMHFITLDQGSGPVSLVQIDLPDRQCMLRIVHNARFDRVKEIDPVKAREAVDASTDLGVATTKVQREREHMITQEVLRWAAQHGCTSQGMRWGRDGEGVLFKTEADAVAWDNANGAEAVMDAPRRRRIVG